MLRENYVAKQQRVGERLTRAMAKAHMDRTMIWYCRWYRAAAGANWAELAIPL